MAPEAAAPRGTPRAPPRRRPDEAARSDAAFHRARKAAKRARYAAELAQPTMGHAAKRIVTRHEGLQEQLGELQDHIMIIATLRELADRPAMPPPVGFACGVLAERHAQARLRARCLFSAGPEH